MKFKAYLLRKLHDTLPEVKDPAMKAMSPRAACLIRLVGGIKMTRKVCAALNIWLEQLVVALR